MATVEVGSRSLFCFRLQSRRQAKCELLMMMLCAIPAKAGTTNP